MRGLAFALCLLALPSQAADFRTLTGHGGPIMAAAVSPDGARALTASFDNAVGLWDLGGDDVRWLDGHEAAVKAVIFLGENRAASAGDDFAVRLWSLETGALEATLSGHGGQVAGLAVSPDGALLASASWDGTVRLWATEDGAARGVLTGHKGAVNAVAFGANGALYSASADGTIRIWDTAQTREVRRMVNHGFGVNTLLLGEGWLAYGAVDGGTRVIDLASDAVLADLTAGRRPILSMALSPDASQMSVGDGEGYVMSVSTGDWRIASDFRAAARGPVWALAYTADGQSLLAGGIDDTGVIWPVAADLSAPILGLSQRGFLGDPATMSNGERQFRRKCSVCHSLDDDGARRAGPTLKGVMGRPAGTLDGYAYSETVDSLALTWDETTIDALFDIGPDGYIPGSKMPQQRITRPEDRRDLIEFLKDNT